MVIFFDILTSICFVVGKCGLQLDVVTRIIFLNLDEQCFDEPF